MYLHIGNETVISLSDVVAVFDARAISESAEGPAFLAAARAQGIFHPTSEDRINSYIVTTDAVYASAISTATLKRRAAHPHAIGEWE